MRVQDSLVAIAPPESLVSSHLRRGSVLLAHAFLDVVTPASSPFLAYEQEEDEEASKSASHARVRRDSALLGGEESQSLLSRVARLERVLSAGAAGISGVGSGGGDELKSLRARVDWLESASEEQQQRLAVLEGESLLRQKEGGVKEEREETKAIMIGGDGKDGAGTGGFQAIDREYKAKGNVVGHECKSSAIAIVVCIPTILVHFLAEYGVKKWLERWHQEMMIRCIFCGLASDLLKIPYKWHLPNFVVNYFGRKLPACAVLMLFILWLFDFNPGMHGWWILVAGGWSGEVALYRSDPSKKYPPPWQYVLKDSVIQAFVHGGLVLVYIFGLMFVLTRF